VSADPEKIVLRKKAEGVDNGDPSDQSNDLPFTKEQLEGKALLIFPIDGITEDGVFSHADTVTDDGDTYTISATPLTFEEIDAATEEDIVRIKTPGTTEVQDKPSDDSPALAAVDDGGTGEDLPATEEPATGEVPTGDPPTGDPPTPETEGDGTKPQALHLLANSQAAEGTSQSLFPQLNFSTGSTCFRRHSARSRQVSA
jgi:hypothetical protein